MQTTTGTGIRASATRVAAHLRALARLERELARNELRRKGASVGAGAGLGAAAAALVPFAVGFGLATVAAALALVVAVWLALLIVLALLLLVIGSLVLASRTLVRRGGPLKPEQALAEARLTRQALKGVRD